MGDFDDDGLQDARTGFLTAGHFAGRNLILVPLEVVKDIPGRKAGEFYDGVVCDVHVLSGPVDKDDFPTIPMVHPGIRMTGKALVDKLKTGVANHTPQVGKMVKLPSSHGPDAPPARVFQPLEPGGEERQAAGAYWKAFKEAEAAKRAKASVMDDPFA